MQCSICLDDLEGGPTLVCGHRFHTACLARLAGANGMTPTRRGALTTCPNCRTVSRVAISTPAAFAVGDRVEALWGQRWYPGVVETVVDGGRAYEIAWDDGDEGEVRAAHVRAAPAPARMTGRTGAVVTPREAPPPVAAQPPAPLRAPTPSTRRARPTPRPVVSTGGRFPCPAGCGRTFDHGPAAVQHGKSCGRPVRTPPPPRPQAPLPPATRSHVASTASAWIAVCTDLLEATKDSTNMEGLREPLVSRGFRCGTLYQGGNFTVTVPPDFPCYYDVVGKDYATQQDHAYSLITLRKYLEGALTLAQTGGAYRTEAEYMDTKPPAPVRAKTSRFTGVTWNEVGGYWVARISVRGIEFELGRFDDEEDTARAFDAALVKYKGKPTVNFPGEAPLASVLAALPDLSSPPSSPAPLPEKRKRTPKVIVDAPDERCPSQKRQAKRPLKRETGKWVGTVEGAYRKANGKWYNKDMFPGREFDDLDAYRAAKKQRFEQRAAYSDQLGRR